MAAAPLLVLRDYASRKRPELLPPDVRLRFTENTLAVFDKFPKAKYHFVLLPRIKLAMDVAKFGSLKTLLSVKKEEALKDLLMLQEEAKPVVKMIEDEMRSTYGFTWKINLGFHAVPSMIHLHLHIISSDLCSPWLKHKKHYNSFHPDHGFFLHLEDVINWFDLPDEVYQERAKMPKSKYEPILKEDLISYHNDEYYATMPKLKAHLQAEFDKEHAVAKKRTARTLKRKSDAAALAEGSPAKKQATESPSSSEQYP